MRTIRFTGERDTPVIGYVENDSPIIERPTHTLVHWRKDEDNMTCPACGGIALIWLSRQNTHVEHPARCTLAIDPRVGAEPTLALSTKPIASLGSEALGPNSEFDSRDGGQNQEAA